MNLLRKPALLTALTIAGMVTLIIPAAQGGVDYLDPAGGWRYTYDGASDAFGSAFSDALDGTWSHDQGDKWDSTAPGDTLSNPGDPVGTPSTETGGPAGTSPGGAGVQTDGSTTYLRIQDTGNPETHGWCQDDANDPGNACFGTGNSTNTNRRVYFGHSMEQDGALAQPLVLSDPAQGVTISFRARIPTTGAIDPLLWLEGGTDADFNRDLEVDGFDLLRWQRNFGLTPGFPNPDPDVTEGNANQDGTVNSADFAIWEDQLGEGPPNTEGWFDGHANGRGAPLQNMRGMINVVQTFADTPENDDIDSSVSFSLLTSDDVTDTCAAAPSGTMCQSSGSGGLVMNNLNGEFDVNTNLNPVIDNVTPGGGTLNLLEMTDSDLNDWNEFWITLENNGATAGNIEVKVYMNGGTSPVDTFQVTLGGNNESVYAKEDEAYIEFGSSTNDGWGSLDVDFLSYSIGVLTPVAAFSGQFVAAPEPSSAALLVVGVIGISSVRRRRR